MIPAKLKPLVRPRNTAETHEAIVQFLMLVWGKYRASEYTFIGTLMDRQWREHAIRGDRMTKIRDILDQNPADHYNLYFCPNAFSRQQRKAEHANNTRYTWYDIDDNPVSNYDPQPNILWRTSPGRHQGLWVWDLSYSGDLAEQYSRNIVNKDGGDRGGWSVTKMLRLPGTINHKPTYDRPTVTLRAFDDRSQALPASIAKFERLSRRWVPISKLGSGDDAVTIMHRYRRKMRLPAGALMTAPSVLGKDRSRAVFQIVAGLISAGAPDADIVTVLLANPYFLAKWGDDRAKAVAEVERIGARIGGAQ